jgi:hypothetical protein
MKAAGPSASGDADPRRPVPDTGGTLLRRYAGLATRYLAVLGVAVWGGWKVDAWLAWELPLCVWLFPLVAILGLVVKAVIDTSDNRPRK